jgi:integrase/recombinase XerD
VISDIEHDLSPVLSRFLNEHLVRDRGLSHLTRLSYAHTFILLVRFISTSKRKHVDKLRLEDVTSDMVLAFLDDLETTRLNSRRSRNLRLAAIRSFFRYVQMKIPGAMEQASRVRALVSKKANYRGSEGDTESPRYETLGRRQRPGNVEHYVYLRPASLRGPGLITQ